MFVFRTTRHRTSRADGRVSRYGSPVTLRRPSAACFALQLCVLGLAASGCSGASAHRTAPPGPSGEAETPAVEVPETPVVLVPGLTGSKLRSRRTGAAVWGRGVDLVWPRDGGYDLALPIAGAPRLEAFAVLETVRLGPARRGIYGPLLRALGARGYRRGRLDSEASLYTFAYDWRRSAVHAAAELEAALEELRRARGEEHLRVDLICQSSGGYVCRWLAKYGGASLEEAAGMPTSGEPPLRLSPGPPPGVEIRRLILVGSANGGALRTLRELDRGRRYLAPWGRRMRPETLFTYPALYEDLPHPDASMNPPPEPAGPPERKGSLFVDGEGEPIPRDRVDLYDPASWKRHGWSVFDPEVARRLERSGRRDLFGTAAEREAFLARALASARRFQELLARDPAGFADGDRPRYYLVGNAYALTPRRAVLLREDGVWRTLFPGDPELDRRPYLRARTAAPGDGHATVASMHHLSPAERDALAAEPFYIAGGHFEMIVKPATHRRILEFLTESPEGRRGRPRPSGSPLQPPVPLPGSPCDPDLSVTARPGLSTRSSRRPG